MKAAVQDDSYSLVMTALDVRTAASACSSVIPSRPGESDQNAQPSIGIEVTSTRFGIRTQVQ